MRTSTKKGPRNIDLEGLCDVKSQHPQEIRWRRPRDGQIGYLEDVLGTTERSIFGTSKGQYLPVG